MKEGEFIQDDMLFKPYKSGSGGWRCGIKIPLGVISVRFGGSGLFLSEDKPYEVWYPDEAEPFGHQTAKDIFDYIRTKNKQS